MISRGKRSAASFVLTIVTGVSIVQALTCPRTEYRIGNKCCSLCPPGGHVGTDCTEDRRTACVRCTAGTYMDMHNRQRHCNTCTPCDPGSGLKVKLPCEPTADTVCVLVEGFFCIRPTEDGCAAAQKHKSCGPGQYIRTAGTASTDTTCSNCSSGTFSDGTLSSCLPHTRCESKKLWTIKAGTASTDAECGEEGFNVFGLFGFFVFVLVIATMASSYVLKWKEKGRSEDSLQTGGAAAAFKLEEQQQPSNWRSSSSLQTGGAAAAFKLEEQQQQQQQQPSN